MSNFYDSPEEFLKHYGTKRHSGRYPWGSGKEPHQSGGGFTFLKEVKSYREKGMSDTEIARKMSLTTTQLRNGITWANNEHREFVIKSIPALEESGLSNTAIASKLGVSEATIRRYKDSSNFSQTQSKLKLEEVEKELVKGVNSTGYLDVGVGAERQLGISRTKFNAVVNKLAKEEGYNIHQIYVRRLSDPTGAKSTTVKVLTKDPDMVNTVKNQHKISTLKTQIDVNGKIANIAPPTHINLDRVKIAYAEEGGADKDGLIELRRGVSDLDLGNSRYAQVRIAAGKDLYLKGMVAYGDDSNFPKGVDIIFNTNKSKGTPVEKVLKKMEVGTDNPFGANIESQKGALNIVNEEGTWDTWSTKMSSQFLSKQPINLIKDRLDDTYAGIRNELNEINELTNPIVKQHLMDEFVEGMDSKAKHLKAKGLSGTKSHVILPFPDMKPNEVFAPNYKNGERVALVRHPHGGRFEIPELIVNNKNETALKMLGNDVPDAIGIHPSVAHKLSGADFDGDTVLVIPNDKGMVKSSRSLKELKNFDPNVYKVDYKTVSAKTKNTQMGVVSNLITDMTIKGASDNELARAVKHSMVVIDSEKHNLDYKQSAIDNGIPALIKKYQTHTNPDTGKLSRSASTLISRSKNKIDISQHETARDLARDRVGKNGEILKKGLTASEIASRLKISEDTVKDYLNGGTFNVDKYSSRTAQEDLYAGYVKNIIATKNEARKISESIPKPQYSREAAKIYAPEVKSIAEKLNTALLNAPRERQAQILTNHLYYTNIKPEMDKDDKKKLRSRSLARARVEVGAKKTLITLTETEWEAVQARAVSNTRLKQVLNNADMDNIRKLASPKATKLNTSKISRARLLLNKGYTYAEVAQVMGVTTTVLREELSSK